MEIDRLCSTAVAVALNRHIVAMSGGKSGPKKGGTVLARALSWVQFLVGLRQRPAGASRNLKPWERIAAAILGGALMLSAGILFYSPPSRIAVDFSAVDALKVHTQETEPTTFVIAIFTAGALLLAFAINGLRIRRVSKDGFETEPAGEGQVTPPPEDNSSGPTVAARADNGRDKTGSRVDEQKTDEGKIPAFSALTPEEQKIMATFWAVQWSFRAKNLPHNWGFVVPRDSPDFPVFWRGKNTLMQRQLIFSDANGLIGLTPRGVEFCTMYDTALRGHADIWRHFVPFAKE